MNLKPTGERKVGAQSIRRHTCYLLVNQLIRFFSHRVVACILSLHYNAVNEFSICFKSEIRHPLHHEGIPL